MVDLHVHSNKSDGSFAPKELVDYALKKGLSAFALTDHDTTEGISEAAAYAKELCEKTGQEIEVIPGIEFSTEYIVGSEALSNEKTTSKDIHIVGLYIDHHSPVFQEQIQAFVNSRVTRNEKMCQNLSGAGIGITYEKLLTEFPGAVVTRAHYARYLLNHGYVKSLSEAFERFIGDHTPYFVPREKVTPAQAVNLILASGGLPVLAHPTLYHLSDRWLEALISELKEAALQAAELHNSPLKDTVCLGIECLYSTYTPSETRKITALADKFSLLPSGGSDFHGSNKPKLDLGCGYGNLSIPNSILDNIKKALGI